MNHSHLYRSESIKLHFKQWSNKGYAAFCSMGKVVHIDNLAISLTQWIGNLIELVEETVQCRLSQEVDEAAEELLEQDMLQVLPVVVSADVECVNKIIRNNNTNCR
ncbi:hypothetical protein [Labilibacter marinus]|uniref:hypothetical protein n=1 Tax=Labilibacter marinus TaxID=1477105 RepID=UPI00083072B9|nr:hypothetical protein [Labilibacter marinus]